MTTVTHLTYDDIIARYQPVIGLETHVFDGTLIQAAHKSMDEIVKIVASL